MLRTLTELCQEINNWFERKVYNNEFVIIDGVIVSHASRPTPVLLDGQYFRIVGSVFNDGIWQYSDGAIEGLKDETFVGAIWALAVPQEVIALVEEIDAWRKKYETVDSQAMSPYNSESFGGYTYSKSSRASGNSGNGDSGGGWKSVYADSLNRWRKI